VRRLPRSANNGGGESDEQDGIDYADTKQPHRKEGGGAMTDSALDSRIVTVPNGGYFRRLGF
jgi:hypothetical protein